MGARCAILPQRHATPVPCPDWIYDNRNQIECLCAKLKEWYAIATRYDKLAASFMSVICLAAALNWLER
jgi:transposase